MSRASRSRKSRFKNMPAGIEDRAKAPTAWVSKEKWPSFKFDWMDALDADPDLDTRAKVIGRRILQHINEVDRIWQLSDEVISDETAIPERWIIRGRKALRACSWIDWERTRRANVYWVLSEKMPAMVAHLETLRKKRAPPPVAEQKSPRAPPQAAEQKSETDDVISQNLNCAPPQVAIPSYTLSTPLPKKVPLRKAQRALRANDLKNEGSKKEPETTSNQWISASTKKERSAEFLKVASEVGLTDFNFLQKQVTAFLEHYRSTAELRSDWPAAWREWLQGIGAGGEQTP